MSICLIVCHYMVSNITYCYFLLLCLSKSTYISIRYGLYVYCIGNCFFSSYIIVEYCQSVIIVVKFFSCVNAKLVSHFNSYKKSSFDIFFKKSHHLKFQGVTIQLGRYFTLFFRIFTKMT